MNKNTSEQLAVGLAEFSISIIVPCHNEANRVGLTFEKIQSHIKENQNKYTGYIIREIIFVENGSSDNTLEILENIKSRARGIIPDTSIRIVVSQKGKGNAVKKGVDSAISDFCLIMDADSSTDISELGPMSKYLQDYTIINTTRRSKSSHIINQQGFLRKFSGNFFHLFVQVLFNLPVKDTQNGFKLIKSDVAKRIFRQIKTSQWVSEVEFFLIAKKDKEKIVEVPITWNNDDESKMKIGDSFQILYQLWLLMCFYKYGIDLFKHRG